MKRYRLNRLALLVPFVFAHQAAARDICEEYQNIAPIPDWVQRHCSGLGAKLIKVGGAYSSFADAFNTNPAAIPVNYTPVGVEYVFSYTGEAAGKKSNFALLKGFQGAGLGASTDSENTFYSNSKIQSRADAPPQFIQSIDSSNISPGTGYNLGGALAPFKEMLGSVLPVAGLAARYSSLTGSWSPVLGFSTRATHFSFGVSDGIELKADGTSHAISATVGARLLEIQGEYIYQQTSTDGIWNTPVHIGTFSRNIFGAQLTAAFRRSLANDGSSRTRFHAALTYPIFKRLTLGYAYNYIPGLQSLSLQAWF